HPDFYLKLRETLSPGDFVTPFNRELAEKLFARLENGQGIEPELLTGHVSETELDEAMRMKLSCADIANPWQECEGCARKLLGEKAGMEKVDVGGLDESAYLEMFSKLKKG
ncbi:MAG: hypothetical protein LBB75_05925, partial [Oscillospiraceae bacterium]|nr:hypothetical protein [Oscillospiraceae bacterium]